MSTSDGLLDQRRVPYVDALVTASERIAAPFFLPGHKVGQGLPRTAAALLSTAARFDLPELEELDNLFAPSGPLAEAQRLAAQAFGARRTWFLANGSSAGIIAAIIGCVRISPAGRKCVLLPRNAHRSAVHGLIHSGALPVWLAPELHASGLVLGVEPTTTLRHALSAHKGSIACVLLVSPSYEGVISDIPAAAALCREAGVPLIVDEAHGAHLGRAAGLPPSSLSCGATLVIQSTHKTLGALSQAAMLHAAHVEDLHSARLDDAVCSAIETVCSSSPSSLLLASLDAARHQICESFGPGGPPVLRRALRLARATRGAFDRHAESFPPLVQLCVPAPGAAALDPLRLTVCARALGGGHALESWLVENRRVYAELASADHLTFAFGPGTRASHVRALLCALRDAQALAGARSEASSVGDVVRSVDRAQSTPLSILDPMLVAAVLKGGEQIASPRDAFYGASVAVPLEMAVGRASAELVYAYPPGVPILCPGECVRAETVSMLAAVRALGGRLISVDTTGRTLLVTVPPS